MLSLWKWNIIMCLVNYVHIKTYSEVHINDVRLMCNVTERFGRLLRGQESIRRLRLTLGTFEVGADL